MIRFLAVFLALLVPVPVVLAMEDRASDPNPFEDRPASEDRVEVERFQRTYPDDHYRNRWSDERPDNTLGPRTNPLSDTVTPGRYEWRVRGEE